MNPNRSPDFMGWLDSPFDSLEEYELHMKKVGAVEYGERVHNTLGQYLNLDQQDFVFPDRQPNLDLHNILREMAKEFLPQSNEDWKVSMENMVVEPVKKVFTTHQVIEKLDSFIREIKTNFPSIDKIVIGGSLGLLFQGYDLGRPIGDLDILIECYEKDSLAVRSYLAKYPYTRSSEGSDFQSCVKYQEIKIDVGFKKNINTVITTYNSKTYLANDYKDIISYKINYSQSNPKHFHDIIKLIDKQPIKKVKFTTNV